MTKKSNNILEFSDGKFAFFTFDHENQNCMANSTIIRVRKSGAGKEARNPKKRIEKLIQEYACQGIPDMVEFYSKNCKKYRPSSPEEIAKWLHSHPFDLFDLVGVLTK